MKSESHIYTFAKSINDNNEKKKKILGFHDAIAFSTI